MDTTHSVLDSVGSLPHLTAEKTESQNTLHLLVDSTFQLTSHTSDGLHLAHTCSLASVLCDARRMQSSVAATSKPCFPY